MIEVTLFFILVCMILLSMFKGLEILQNDKLTKMRQKDLEIANKQCELFAESVKLQRISHTNILVDTQMQHVASKIKDFAKVDDEFAKEVKDLFVRELKANVERYEQLVLNEKEKYKKESINALDKAMNEVKEAISKEKKNVKPKRNNRK